MAAKELPAAGKQQRAGQGAAEGLLGPWPVALVVGSQGRTRKCPQGRGRWGDGRLRDPQRRSRPRRSKGLGPPELEVGRLGGGPRLTQQCLGAGWESLILPGNDGGPWPRVSDRHGLRPSAAPSNPCPSCSPPTRNPPCPWAQGAA